jgi:hypothetical protein
MNDYHPRVGAALSLASLTHCLPTSIFLHDPSSTSFCVVDNYPSLLKEPIIPTVKNLLQDRGKY